jgi:hypothetical protein
MYQRIRDAPFLKLVRRYIHEELPPPPEEPPHTWDDDANATRIQNAYRKRAALAEERRKIVNPLSKVMCLQIPLLTIESIITGPAGIFLLVWGLINAPSDAEWAIGGSADEGGGCGDQKVWLVVAGSVALGSALWTTLYSGFCSASIMLCPQTKCGKVCGIVAAIIQGDFRPHTQRQPLERRSSAAHLCVCSPSLVRTLIAVSSRPLLLSSVCISFPVWCFFVGWGIYGAVLFHLNPYSGRVDWTDGCIEVQKVGWLAWMIAMAVYTSLLLFAVVYNIVVAVCVGAQAKKDALVLDPNGKKKAARLAAAQAKKAAKEAVQKGTARGGAADAAATATAGFDAAEVDGPLGDAEASGEEDDHVATARRRRHTEFYAKGSKKAAELEGAVAEAVRGEEHHIHWCVTLAEKPCCCCFKYFHMAHGTFGRLAAVTMCCADADACWNKPDDFGEGTWLHKAGPWNQACTSTFVRWFCAPWVVPLHTIATSWFFDTTITALILLNTVTLCLDTYPVIHSLTNSVEWINFCLTSAFTLELILKFPGIGFRKYCKDPFNCFDMFIVILSLAETLLTPPSFFETTFGLSGSPLKPLLALVGVDAGEGSGGALSALRTFRVLRLFKLATKIDGLPQLLMKMAKAFANGVYFMVILLLHIFVFALFGMQLFANRLHFDATTHYAISLETITSEAATAAAGGAAATEFYTPRHNFDKFLNAFITVWQVLTGENWNNVMYDCRRGTMDEQHFTMPTLQSVTKFFTSGELTFAMERSGGYTADTQGLYTVDFSWAPIYFMILMVTGAWVVLDFYLAVLLSDFEPESDELDGDEGPFVLDEDGDGIVTAEEAKAFAKKTHNSLMRCKCTKKKRKKVGAVDENVPMGHAEDTAETIAEMLIVDAFESGDEMNSAASKLQKKAYQRAMKRKAAEQKAMLDSWVTGNARPRALRRAPMRPPMDLSADAVDGLCCCLRGRSLCVVEQLTDPAPEPDDELLPMRGQICFCVRSTPFPTSWKQMKTRDKLSLPLALLRRAVAVCLQNTPADCPCLLFKEGERVVVNYNADGQISEFDPAYRSDARIVNIDRPWPTPSEPSMVRWETHPWPSVFAVQRIEWTTVQIEEVMKRMDTVELTVADMKKLMPASMAPGHVEDLVRHFDKDGSGTIDRYELEELLRVSPLSAPVARNIPLKDVAHQSRCTRCQIKTLSFISFDNVILLLIAISSVMLALETPMDQPGSVRLATMGYIEIVINIIFTMEVFLKVRRDRERGPTQSLVLYFSPFSLSRSLFLSVCSTSAVFSAASSALGRSLTLLLLLPALSSPPSPITQIIAYGTFEQRYSYCRDVWNLLDVFVVGLSWITAGLEWASELIGGGGGSFVFLKALKVMRLLRVLRVLRGIKRLKGLQKIVNGMAFAFAPVLQTTPILLLFMLIFAIIFTSLLKGSLSACTLDESDGNYTAKIALLEVPVDFSALTLEQLAWQSPLSNRTDFFTLSQPLTNTGLGVCEWLGGEWETVVPQSFDNVILAMTSLFQLITTEAWIDVAFAASDSVGMEMQPIIFGQECVPTSCFVVSFVRAHSLSQRSRARMLSPPHLRLVSSCPPSHITDTSTCPFSASSCSSPLSSSSTSQSASFSVRLTKRRKMRRTR